MAEKIVAMIQARMGSRRLPGKMSLPLGDSTVLEQVLDRVSRSEKLDEVVLVTTIDKSDLPLVRLCSQKNIRVFCGSENDVLDRYYQAAKIIKPDHVVRITGDCPLMDPDVIDCVIKRHLESNADYTSNVLKESYPDGLDVEIFSFAALKKSWEEAELKSDREHVTLYIRNNPESFKLLSVENETDLSSLRWTLDEEADYLFITKIYNLLDKSDSYGMGSVLNIICSNPSLGEINNNITRNEGLMKSLKEDGGV